MGSTKVDSRTLFDFAQSDLNRLVELRGKRRLDGFIGSDLEVLRWLRGNRDALGVVGRSIFCE